MDIRNIAFGVYQVREEEGWFYFDRFNESQKEYLRMIDESFYRHALLSSGVTLEFVTSSRKFSFDYRFVIKESKDSFDLFVDGKRTDQRFVALLEDEGKITFENLPEGKKRIVLFFPFDTGVAIKNFSCLDVEPIEKDTKVLWVGDSITQGYGVYQSGDTYLDRFQRLSGFDILNQGLAGYYCDPSFDLKLSGYDPDFLVLSEGTNQHKRESAFEEVKKTIAGLQKDYPNKALFVISPLRRFDNDFDAKKLDALRDYMNAPLAEELHYHPIDGLSLLSPNPSLYFDLLHPNSEGAKEIAENMKRQMDVVFQSQTTKIR